MLSIIAAIFHLYFIEVSNKLSNVICIGANLDTHTL